jgi:hypothetical protein
MKHIQGLKMLAVAAAIATPFCLMVSAPVFGAKPMPVCIVGHSHGSIQDAVEDTTCEFINVPEGIYYANIIIARDVTIRGAGMEHTIVDGSLMEAPVFNISARSPTDNHTVTIKGMTITGGTSPRNNHPYGGGITSYASTLTVKDCFITGNTATDFAGVNGNGGGIASAVGLVVVKDSVIAGNRATNGGGIRGGGGGGVIIVVDSVIKNNRATNFGGGLYGESGVANGSSLTVKGSVVTENSALLGGGIYYYNSTLTVVDSDITGNTPDQVAHP